MSSDTYPLHIPRSWMTVLLGFLFTLAFILSPYWSLAASPIMSVALLSILIVAGVVWCLAAAAGLELAVSRKDLWIFLLLALGLFLINIRQLPGAIPASGDESFHIGQTLGLVSPRPAFLLLFFLLAVPTTLFLLTRRKIWGALVFGAVVLVIIGAIHWLKPFGELNSHYFLRYPFVNYWLAAILPNASAAIAHPYHEYLFRVIPFFSAVSIAWLFQRELPADRVALRLLWGFAVGLIPVVLFHASLFYVDIPVILLMLWVCLRSPRLLRAGPAQLKQVPAWYALILIGFLKETTLPFLACFLVLRWLVQLHIFLFGRDFQEYRLKKIDRQTALAAGQAVWDEIGIACAVLIPLFIYLSLRGYFDIPRGYSFNPANWLNLPVYRTFFKALWQQFGLFLLFFVLGVAYLLARKETLRLGFLLLVAIGYPLFYLADDTSLPYTGYSRFNLFLIPPLLAASAPLAAWLAARRPKWGAIVVSALLISNLVLFPIHLDGSKKTFWKFSEHSYAYPQAIRWLKENYPDKKILFAGLRSGYPFNFYFAQNNWTPDYQLLPSRGNATDAEALQNTFPAIENCKQCILVFHLFKNEIPDVPLPANLKQKMIFRNQAHTLVIYRVAAP